MAVQWMDDFSSYGVGVPAGGVMTNGPYAFADAWIAADPDPSGSGQPVLILQSPAAGRELRKVMTGPLVTVGVAARYWIASIPSASNQLPRYADFRSLNNTSHLFVTCDPSGYMVAFRNDDAGLVEIGRSDGPVMIANAWRHVEVKAVLHDSAGEVEVRIEGAPVLSVTAVRTTTDRISASDECYSVALRNSSAGAAGPWFYVKDLIIWDDTGGKNDNFMGSCQVYKIVPESDVSLGWTPSAGATGWDLINEDDPDDDAEYITAPHPPPALSKFEMTDLPIDVTSVKAVLSIHRSRKTDGGDGTVQIGLDYMGNISLGQDRTITSAWTYWFDTFDNSPDGGNWSKAKVDALKMSIDRTS